METCPICFKEIKNVRRHLTVSHGDKNFLCEFEENGQICGKKFVSGSLLKQHHTQIHSGIRRFSCEICLQTFKKKEDWRCHQMNLHEGRKIKCDICPTLMGSKNYYSKHVRGHHRDLDANTLAAFLKKIKETPEEKLFNHRK
jgi:KRAB domain-containing zinc finger protein